MALCLLFIPLVVNAERVRVRIFSNVTVERINVSFDLGAYNLTADDAKVLESELSGSVSVELRRDGNRVHVAVDGYDYGSFAKVRLDAVDSACILCLNPKGSKQRTYEGNLEVTPLKKSGLLVINDVDFETYIAGVVQSEIYGDKSDIFRIQAIISRTWALRNINKHKADGYNFCDQVHCQAYLNRCVRPDIMLGTIASAGETIVDSSGSLIETPFHSNSGGQTANSEDVWRNRVPYLRSVQDTFSFRMRQSDWTKVVAVDKWMNYFSKQHVDVANDSIRRILLTFTQQQRCAKLLGVPLTRIRVDFQLKSTFFSVSFDSTRNQVVLHGHGYGHGVGLSQEGTIRMVGLGFAYDSIICHYYHGAHIYRDPNVHRNYVQNYVNEIERIIIEDQQNKSTKPKSKKDDWLGRLFRQRDRDDREEVYDANSQDLEQDFEYEW